MMEYPFPEDIEAKEYRLFADDIENDVLVAFHGTARENLQSIVENGFKHTRKLKSVSFAKQSPLALKYACCARSESSPDGCVLAVRFISLGQPGISNEHSIIHVNTLDIQPTIIGFCVVPATYVFR